MRGGFTRPVVTLPHALTLLLLLALSGCSLFRSPPPVQPEPPVSASEPEAAASEPEAASAPEVASETEETAGAKTAPKKPHPSLIHRRRPTPTPPAPASAPAVPAPAPLVSTRTLERSTFRTLLDSEVQKTDGKVVGRAVDLVAGPGGKPIEVVVNLQGFMGIGDRKAWFPWSNVRVNTQPKTPAITLTLVTGQSPALDRPKAGGAPQQPSLEEAGPTRLPMLDASVERPNGAKVGRVVDVLLDASADPLAVVLDVSGTLEKRQTIAADWAALHFVTKNRVLTAQLDMTDQQIDASPRYASDASVRAVKPNPPAAPTAPAAPAASAATAAPAASSRGAQ
ncbi:PRC-barrel domain-containing protein [Paraburkholderia adhaesiva]|uniref:PRC-barrel domain-containing protein n=1 Tax=Paraburkholderia adhaesiva TaxID=2883244 RepID=UPI001F368B73|nr:PRC-barrel domain-containing protein [Paraburkholderia adhaesiva]